MAGEMDRKGGSAPTRKVLQSAETGQGIQIPVAWAVLLIASNWYYILWGEPEGALHWPPLAQALTLLIIAAAISFSPRLKALRGFVVSLAAFDGGNWARFAIESNVQWFRTAPFADRIFADAVLAGIPAGFMMLAAIIGGYRRRDLFLVAGQPGSRTTLPLLHRAKWTVVGPVVLIVTSAGLTEQLRLVAGQSRSWHILEVQALGVALLFATVNASFEEIRFRCVLLAHAEPVVGRTHAIWLTAVLFGLAHWGGHPAGISGMIMAGFLGWLLATSILDTRGWVWAWLIHAIEDVIIFWSIVATGR